MGKKIFPISFRYFYSLLVCLIAAVPFFLHAQVGSCQITISAKVPATIPEPGGPFTISGTVTSNQLCTSDVTIESFLVDTVPKKIKAGTSSSFDFTGMTRDVDIQYVHFDGDLGLTGDYPFTTGIVKATDACGYQNTAVVYSCSDNHKGTCPSLPKDKLPPSTATSRADQTVKEESPPVTVNDIVGEPYIILHPAYIKETEKTRGFTPTLPISPFDDFDVVIDKINRCSGVEPVFSASLMTVDKNGTEVPLADSNFSLKGQGAVAEFKGWPDGVTTLDSSLKVLVESINRGRPIFVRISDGGSNLDIPVPQVTACAHLYNKGAQKIISLSSIAEESPSARVNSIGDIWNNGFLHVNPYKKYAGDFAIYADLGYRELSIKDPLGAMQALAEKAKQTSIPVPIQNRIIASIFKDGSACGKGLYLMAVQDVLLSNKIAGIAMVDYPGMQGLLYDTRMDSTDLPNLIMHEFSHAFASLNDEYVYQQKATKDFSLKNCSPQPLVDYKFKDKIYGATDMNDCSFQTKVDKKTGKTVPIYKPSAESMMSDFSKVPFFNVVSCGFILSTIKGGDPKSYFPGCSTLSDIILSERGHSGNSVAADKKVSLLSDNDLKSSQLAQINSSNEQDKPEYGLGYVIVDAFNRANSFIAQITPDDVLNAPLITIVNGKAVAASGDITIVRDSTVPIVVKIAGVFPGLIKSVYMRSEVGDLYLFSPKSVTHESLSFQITASEDIVPSGIYKLYIQDDGQLLSNEVSIFLRAATEHHRGNECDLGYHEDVNGECVLDDVNPPPPPPPPPIDSGPLSQLVTCGFDLNKDGIVEGHTVDANGLQEECDFNALVRMAQRIINFLLYMSVAIAAAAFAMAGFKYVTARGNVGQIESAHKIFTNVLVGLLIALAAWLVINTVTSGLLGDNASKFRILKQQSR